MSQKTCLTTLRFGGLDCRLSAITPEWEPGLLAQYHFHCHNGFELQAVLRGRLCIRTTQRVAELFPGQGVLIAPGSYHTIHTASEDLQLVCIGFELPRPETIQRTHARALSQLFYHQSQAVLSLENCLPHLMELSRLARQQTVSFWEEERLKAAMTLLILTIYDALGGAAVAKELMVQDTAQLTPIIDNFFSHHYNLNNGNELLARMLHITPRQLNRVLQKQYHMSYQEKLTETRLVNALDYLTATDMPIREIAEKVGYASVSNFSAFIRRATGESPRDIRKHRTSQK